MYCDESSATVDSQIRPVDEYDVLSAKAGYETDKIIDEEDIDEFGWFANKDLVGKYQWSDPTGVNWLLEQAGIAGKIDSIAFVGDGVVVAIGVGTYLLGMSNPITAFMSLGLFVVGAYSDYIHDNAKEKADLALSLIAQQKNYAVYEG